MANHDNFSHAVPYLRARCRCGGQTRKASSIRGFQEGAVQSFPCWEEEELRGNLACLSPLAKVPQGAELLLLNLSVDHNLCCPLGELAQERRLLSMHRSACFGRHLGTLYQSETREAPLTRQPQGDPRTGTEPRVSCGNGCYNKK